MPFKRARWEAAYNGRYSDVVFVVGREPMQPANGEVKSLCLCAIVPLCLAPEKTEIAKQVSARCGQLVELLLKSDRQ